MKEYLQKIKQRLPVQKISRNYFRLSVGAGLIGAPLGWLFNSVEIYGIFRPFILAYVPWLSIAPFAIFGCVIIFLLTFWIGYIWERLDMVKEQTSFLNLENNPQWIQWDNFMKQYEIDTDYIKNKLKELTR